MEQTLIGQLYLYSPSFLKKHLVGPLTGYNRDDLKPGGRLEAAKTVKETRHATFAARIANEKYQGDKSDWIKAKFLSYDAENPLRYVASMLVFASKAFNLVVLLCFFGVFFGALLMRQQVLIAAFGLPAGLFFFISLFSHALTRYNAAMTPFVILACLWFLVALARLVYIRFLADGTS
jgi:hypothetical protein